MKVRSRNIISILYSLAVVGVLIFAVAFYLNDSNGSKKTDAPSQTVIKTGDKPVVEEIPIFSDIFSGNMIDDDSSWSQNAVEIIFRLLFAVMLSTVLAFRPRRDTPFLQRNLYVAQTQILLAIVAAALMMIVGNNAVRAFAIFAAVSLVRFRTNIRDPKEISVLLISLALGLAAGVGRWELGILLCLFVLVVLWVLEYNESEQVFRSMELSIETKDTDKSHDRIKQIFERYNIDSEVRQLDPPDDEGKTGCITYRLELSLDMSTNNLSNEILTEDEKNIESLEWKHKKRNTKYLYES